MIRDAFVERVTEMSDIFPWAVVRDSSSTDVKASTTVVVIHGDVGISLAKAVSTSVRKNFNGSDVFIFLV